VDGRWRRRAGRRAGARHPLDGAPPSVVVPGAAEPGRVGAWSIASGNVLAYALETVKGPAELYVVRGREPARRVTDLNGPLLAERFLAEVDSLVFKGADGL
jgi:dipeptidyl aminopeptidase/acylaminoacyl peptidase